jgi:DNA invertase Pin-like site-specific DNA recombinase
MNEIAKMSGKKIGYIRVSTVGQNTERQLEGVELDKVFEEKVSAKTRDRPQLNQMLEYIRDGDSVVVHDISRLARNIQDLHHLVACVTEKGATLQFKKEGLVFSSDKSDPMSQLLLSMLGAVYQFEREIMKERQREGIAIAKRAGKFKGRPKTISDEDVLQLVGQGNSIAKTAQILGVSKSSVQRAKRSAA